MKKVKPTGISTIKIIPRKYALNLTFKLRDRLTDMIDTLTTSLGTDQNFMTVTFEATDGFLVDGHQYDFWLVDDDDDDKVVYRDTILCSAQDIDQEENEVYNINKDVYESHNTGDNSYIVID